MFSKLKHVGRVVHGVVREHLKSATRSSHWSKVRKEFIKLNPTCAACGGTKRLNVHHKVPFHKNPALELDPSNLITLCLGPLECHIQLGHAFSYKWFNPNIVEDAASYLVNPSKRQEILKKAKESRLPL